ncbi:hypothetical protein A4X17_10960 [Plantibacter sp. H53]|nr:hypothetical protein A4X17_10960 [Plantibacter sp. H53]
MDGICTRLTLSALTSAAGAWATGSCFAPAAPRSAASEEVMGPSAAFGEVGVCPACVVAQPERASAVRSAAAAASVPIRRRCARIMRWLPR